MHYISSVEEWRVPIIFSLKPQFGLKFGFKHDFKTEVWS